MNRAYRIALICGVTPLVIGVSVFMFWVITRWDWLMMAGIYVLYGGIAIVLVGFVALTRFCWLALRTPKLTHRSNWFSTLCCAGLLLLNFPVAGGIIEAAIAIESSYTVVVNNALPHPLESVRVYGGGSDESLGTVLPGGSVRQSFWIQHDGELNFRAYSGDTSYAKTIRGYVTNAVGGYTAVTINSDGTISVNSEDD